MLDKTPPRFGQRPNGSRPATLVRRPAAEPQAPASHPAAPADAATAGDAPAREPTPSASMPAPVMAQPPASAGPEARWARRTASRLGAQILHPTLSQPIACTVRDTSSTGARIEVAAQRGGNISRESVPELFTLFMPNDRLEVDCQVMWRQGPLIGVRYTAPARRTAKLPPPRQPDAPKKPHTSLLNLLINPL